MSEPETQPETETDDPSAMQVEVDGEMKGTGLVEEPSADAPDEADAPEVDLTEVDAELAELADRGAALDPDRPRRNTVVDADGNVVEVLEPGRGRVLRPGERLV